MVLNPGSSSHLGLHLGQQANLREAGLLFDVTSAARTIGETLPLYGPCQTKSGPMHHGMRLARQVGIPSEDQAMTVPHLASAAERLCL